MSAFLTVLAMVAAIAADDEKKNALKDILLPPDPRPDRVPKDWDSLRLYQGTLHTPAGRIRELQKIGSGRFSTVYERVEVGDRRATYADRNGRTDEIWVFTRSECYDKEILASVHEEDPENRYLPRITRIGSLEDGDRVYLMPRYKTPLRREDSLLAWEQYRLLKEAKDEAWAECHHRDPQGFDLGLSGYCTNVGVIDRVRTHVEPALTSTLQTLTDECSLYGEDYVFEFSPRNLATDGDGHLVLLDPVFSVQLLRKDDRRLEKARHIWGARGR